MGSCSERGGCNMKIYPELNSRQEILLVFLGVGDAQMIDPIRIMKGIFIFSEEAPDEWIPRDARYQFKPYNYGPCSFQIYFDLDHLENCGYVTSVEVPTRSWSYYLLSTEGKELVPQLVREMNQSAIRYLERIRDFVSNLSFRLLLEVVYQRYPDYAVNSVFKF